MIFILQAKREKGLSSHYVNGFNMNVSANNEELIQRIKDGDEEAKKLFL